MKFFKIMIVMFCMVQGLHAETRVITVQPGQSEFKVTLAANPTTGYLWKIRSYDKNLMDFVSSQYLRLQNNRIGAGGNIEFIFRIRPVAWQPVQSTMEFSYARPWEKQGARMETVKVRFSH